MSAPAITVTFLGTGGGVPSLDRNLPCVAVQRQGDLFLFDCGEAAQIQYRRAGLGFAPLRGIGITHMHGDHITGLMGLLMSLQMADRTEPLELFGPPGLGEYLRCNKRALNTGFGYPINLREESEATTFIETKEYRITAAPLDHRGLCLGFRFEEAPRPGRFDVNIARELGVPFGPLCGQLQRGEAVTLESGAVVQPEQVLGPTRPGAVLTYCTDTRPCPNAVELARGADILIYEGTFEAGMGADARRKGHSTVAEAAGVAEEAGARELIITHLSPRYANTDQLKQQARAIFPNTRIARDLKVFEIMHRES